MLCQISSLVQSHPTALLEVSSEAMFDDLDQPLSGTYELMDDEYRRADQECGFGPLLVVAQLALLLFKLPFRRESPKNSLRMSKLNFPLRPLQPSFLTAHCQRKSQSRL